MKRFLPVLLILAELFLMLYSPVSSLRHTRRQMLALDHYRAAAARLEPDIRQRLLEGAEAENDPALLAVEESGIIGFVTIPRLQAELPIYSSTSAAALCNGAGLLEGSSLPLGGAGRHSVLSAHRLLVRGYRI